MGDDIGFQEPRLRLIPLLEGAEGDLLLEQGSRTRRCQTTLALGSGASIVVSTPMEKSPAIAA